MKEAFESVVEKRFSCMDNCPLNETGKGFHALLKDPDSCGQIGSVTTPRGLKPLLRFSPTGNFVPDPYVIVCGKTADKSTQKNFWDQSRSGDPPIAAHEMIFSTESTRNTLYKELIVIGLFDLLRKVKPDVWEGLADEEGWNRLFQGDKWQENYGIQLTQACNCAIIRTEKNKYTSEVKMIAKEPTRSMGRALAAKNPSCLFNSFPDPDRLTNLKLVIFLDTPPFKKSRGEWRSFHQVDFFDNSELGMAYKRKDINIISIPHPSGFSYRHTDPISVYEKYDSDEKQTDEDKRAAELLHKAKAMIDEITKNIEETR